MQNDLVIVYIDALCRKWKGRHIATLQVARLMLRFKQKKRIFWILMMWQTRMIQLTLTTLLILKTKQIWGSISWPWPVSHTYNETNNGVIQLNRDQFVTTYNKTSKNVIQLTLTSLSIFFSISSLDKPSSSWKQDNTIISHIVLRLKCRYNNNNNNNNNNNKYYIDRRIFLNLSKLIQSTAGLKLLFT